MANHRSKQKPASPEAKYILDRMYKRNTADSSYQLAQRTKIYRGTLQNMFYKHRQPFRSAHLLMNIAADLGTTMEAILTQSESKYDKDKELNYWKERCFKSEDKLKALEKKVKESVDKLK